MKKYLLFLFCLVWACTPPPPKEITLALPHPKMQRAVPALPQPRHFMTPKDVALEKKDLQDSYDEILSRLYSAEWLIRHDLYVIQDQMNNIIDSIHPDIDGESLLEKERLLVKYAALYAEYLKFELKLRAELDDLEKTPI